MQPEPDNIVWHVATVDPLARATRLGQRPCVVWLTGLSGAGKSSLANSVEARLFEAGFYTYLIDGDNLRHGLNADLGFGAVDRFENVRRAGEVARLMMDAGLIVLVALISPFRFEREQIRKRFQDGEFIEIYVNAPLSVCEARDTKGLYARARRGEVPQFTGIDSPYEPPLTPDIEVRTDLLTIEEATRQILDTIGQRKLSPDRYKTSRDAC